jgi:hypothetical protein
MDLRKYGFTTSSTPDKKTNQKQKKRRKNMKKREKGNFTPSDSEG